MKELHYGEGYEYAHDTQEKLTAMQCLPDSLEGTVYYRPTEEGAEARVRQRKQQIDAWRAQRRAALEKKKQSGKGEQKDEQ